MKKWGGDVGECVGKCVGVWGEVRGEVCGVWRKVRRDGGVKKCRRTCGKCMGVSVGKCVVMWRGEGRGMRGVGKGRGCEEVWGWI